MKIFGYLFLVLLLVASKSAHAEKSIDTDAAVLKNIAAILQIPVHKLRIAVAFSKQIVPGDALDIVEIVMAIEDNLKITINDDELDKQVGSKSIADLPQKLTVKMLQEIVRENYARTNKSIINNGKKGVK